MMSSQKDHIFASIIAYCKLEFLKTKTFLTRISHTILRAIAAPLAEIASQIDKAVLLKHCPCLSERQDRLTECASAPRECEKCGLITLCSNTNY